MQQHCVDPRLRLPRLSPWSEHNGPHAPHQLSQMNRTGALALASHAVLATAQAGGAPVHCLHGFSEAARGGCQQQPAGAPRSTAAGPSRRPPSRPTSGCAPGSALMGSPPVRRSRCWPARLLRALTRRRPASWRSAPAHTGHVAGARAQPVPRQAEVLASLRERAAGEPSRAGALGRTCCRFAPSAPLCRQSPCVFEAHAVCSAMLRYG